MASGTPPKIFMFTGINAFLVMSFSISVFDKQFPKLLPCVLQIATLAGFSQMRLNYTLLFASMETRFWNSLLFLAMSIVSVIMINLYFGIRKKKLSSAGILMGVFTIPVSAILFFVISAYTNGTPISIPVLPVVLMQFLGEILVASMIIMGVSIYVYLKPDKLKKLLAKQKQCKPNEIILQTHLNTDDTKNKPLEEVKKH